MRRYLPMASWEDNYRLHVPSMTVMSQEPQEKFSGLYDANGNKLYAVERSEPIGFLRFGETAQ